MLGISSAATAILTAGLGDLVPVISSGYLPGWSPLVISPGDFPLWFPAGDLPDFPGDPPVIPRWLAYRTR